MNRTPRKKLLAVDSGNTRIKWALFSASGIVLQNGAMSAGAMSQMRTVAERICESGKTGGSAESVDGTIACRVSHVGNESRREKLRAALECCGDVRFAKSEARAGGVVNLYRPPESLGVDRWLSALAVRGMFGKRGGWEWTIVSVGTATTVDGLTAKGEFIGGLILPGPSSFPGMLKKTTALPPALLSQSRLSSPLQSPRESPSEKSPLVSRPPRDTSSAVATGALLSTAGAALEFRRRFLPGSGFILTGGDANKLSPFLPRSRTIPDLVLRGLLTTVIAEATKSLSAISADRRF